jgi:selenocysteine lyase/cysteine desulfurase
LIQIKTAAATQAMRVTPHLWNTDEDVETLLAVLRTAL